ncbi:unnamed protein product [Cyclocybe aegerita]|uniref:Uncharacterized protein n=1 Tax=Cyclocybe aegerita TaxID=1973307 RepID=A0A8S0W7U4_CYCAE|nr:unnamed protein product [Cyclocybe aegerita]
MSREHNPDKGLMKSNTFIHALNGFLRSERTEALPRFEYESPTSGPFLFFARYLYPAATTVLMRDGATDPSGRSKLSICCSGFTDARRCSLVPSEGSVCAVHRNVARHDGSILLADDSLRQQPVYRVGVLSSDRHQVVMVLEEFQIKRCNASFRAAHIALAIPLSSVIWVIPAISIATFIYHIIILFVGSWETTEAPRLYTKYCIACAYAAAVLWIANLGVAITYTALLYANKLHQSTAMHKIWLPIITAVSLSQSLLLVFMAIKLRREIKEIEYRNKWRWRIGSPANGSQWSIAKLSS